MSLYGWVRPIWLVELDQAQPERTYGGLSAFHVALYLSAVPVSRGFGVVDTTSVYFYVTRAYGIEVYSVSSLRVHLPPSRP